MSDVYTYLINLFTPNEYVKGLSPANRGLKENSIHPCLPTSRLRFTKLLLCLEKAVIKA